ncbi:hypothetical protein L1987_79167 [Smallanthus sonchifolius]|uniref:Uncharacterized protein n=1 Tax=Smallanthus sonchifolius TaxID=185202 RepID=A0ACB8ZDS2_9ASTR|nr:hypothetical protein L1987_79167 [Smallanthus sonchifolius]
MDDDKESICKVVASLTPGLVGADLENIVQEFVLIAARIGGQFVIQDDIFQAVDGAKGKVYDHDVQELAIGAFKGQTMYRTGNWSIQGSDKGEKIAATTCISFTWKLGYLKDV